MKAFPDSALLKQSVPVQPGLQVLVAPYAGRENMLVIAARLALRGPLRVLDGGNRFNAYVVARMLRYLGAGNLAQSLRQIQVARAFTCYQMVKMLEQNPPQPLPLLVIDLLDTFYDESASLDERRRLGEYCAMRLRGLGRESPVVVSLRPPRPPLTDPTGLLEIVQGAADQVWFQDGEFQPEPAQPALFQFEPVRAELVRPEPVRSEVVRPGLARGGRAYAERMASSRLPESLEGA